jgi:segregation and condensation protein A
VKEREPFQPPLDFEAAAETAAWAAEQGEALIVDVDGFEGPLHLLLALARSQKVDLLKLSITTLADQYLAFVRTARQRQFSLAADYLVMASWLTYLKSRLLLPKPERIGGEEPPATEVASALAFRLAKLDAMRRAGEALKALPQTGRDIFVRGDPDAIAIHSTSRLDVGLYDLVRAYADQQRRTAGMAEYRATSRVSAYPLELARERLRDMLNKIETWTPLSGLAPVPAATDSAEPGPSRASYVASTLSAGLELVKEGELEARQLEAFADVYMRRRIGERFESAA